MRTDGQWERILRSARSRLKSKGRSHDRIFFFYSMVLRPEAKIWPLACQCSEKPGGDSSRVGLALCFVQPINLLFDWHSSAQHVFAPVLPEAWVRNSSATGLAGGEARQRLTPRRFVSVSTVLVHVLGELSCNWFAKFAV